MIKSFSGDHAFLSNFHQWPLKYKGIEYATSEHAYQAAKTNDSVEKLKIRCAPSAGKAKRFGAKATLRKDWDIVKDNIMYEILCAKFEDEILREWLLNTGTTELQEGNNWGDVWWGVDEKTGKGENRLGKLLMRIRNELS